MKKVYDPLEILVIRFSAEDVIRTSGGELDGNEGWSPLTPGEFDNEDTW